MKTHLLIYGTPNYANAINSLIKSSKNLNILPFNKLILYFNLQLKQKFQHGFLPTSFSQTWSDNRVRRGNQLEILDFSKKGKSFKHPLC